MRSEANKLQTNVPLCLQQAGLFLSRQLWKESRVQTLSKSLQQCVNATLEISLGDHAGTNCACARSADSPPDSEDNLDMRRICRQRLANCCTMHRASHRDCSTHQRHVNAMSVFPETLEAVENTDFQIFREAVETYELLDSCLLHVVARLCCVQPTDYHSHIAENSRVH